MHFSEASSSSASFSLDVLCCKGSSTTAAADSDSPRSEWEFAGLAEQEPGGAVLAVGIPGLHLLFLGSFLRHHFADASSLLLWKLGSSQVKIAAHPSLA